MVNERPSCRNHCQQVRTGRFEYDAAGRATRWLVDGQFTLWAVPAGGGDPVAVLPGTPDAFQFDVLAVPTPTGPINSPVAGLQ